MKYLTTQSTKVRGNDTGEVLSMYNFPHRINYDELKESSEHHRSPHKVK